MRCSICGWIVGEARCPCGATEGVRPGPMVPIGSRVLARAGRGPSMARWERGEVQGHLGPVHRVSVSYDIYWCEADDLLPDSPRRDEALSSGQRIWGLWVDGRWYPGTVDRLEGPLRHVAWDDGDAMWVEAHRAVVMARDAGPPEVGQRVQACGWDGEYKPATIVERQGARFRVSFPDDEDAWVVPEAIKTFPPNPFLEPGRAQGGA